MCSELDNKLPLLFVATSPCGAVMFAFGLFDNDVPVIGHVFEDFFEFLCIHDSFGVEFVTCC